MLKEKNGREEFKELNTEWVSERSFEMLLKFVSFEISDLCKNL